MYFSLHGYIRRYAKDMAEGEVVVKFKAQPKVKPPRRKSPVKNESNRTDYMKLYMKEYRSEEGKDYQKMPDKIKELRKKQRKEKKKKSSIEDVRVYNKALTPSEVGQIYIKSNPNNKIELDPSARVGIGSNTPISELCVTSNDNNVLIIS